MQTNRPNILRVYAKKKQSDLNDQMQQTIHDQAKDMESRFQTILATVTQNQAASSGTQHSSLPQTVKLPTISIKQFSGDILEWMPFWENFAAAIDQSKMSDVEKLSYLRSYLKGEPLLVIANLSLTAANYAEAKKQLDHVDGKKNILIEAHLKKLENLPAVKQESEV